MKVQDRVDDRPPPVQVRNMDRILVIRDGEIAEERKAQRAS